MAGIPTSFSRSGTGRSRTRWVSSEPPFRRFPVASAAPGSKMPVLEPVRAGGSDPGVHPQPEGLMPAVLEKKPAATNNPFEVAQRQFDIAAEALKLEDGIRLKLRVPRRALIVSVPFEMDDGSWQVVQGYRVQHDVSRGPAKGGIRYHPQVTLDEVKAL